MDYKAEYIGKRRDKNGYAVHLFYRYRDHEYMITDEHNGYSESMVAKHRYAQRQIDKMIEDRSKSNDKGEPAEIALNEFFDYLDGKDSEFNDD